MHGLMREGRREPVLYSTHYSHYSSMMVWLQSVFIWGRIYVMDVGTMRHDELIARTRDILVKLNEANLRAGTVTIVEGYSFTGPIALDVSWDLPTMVTEVFAPVPLPWKLPTYLDVIRNANHPVYYTVGDRDPLTLLGGVSWSETYNGTLLQYGNDATKQAVDSNSFNAVTICQGIWHDGEALKYNCTPR